MHIQKIKNHKCTKHFVEVTHIHSRVKKWIKIKSLINN